MKSKLEALTEGIDCTQPRQNEGGQHELDDMQTITTARASTSRHHGARRCQDEGEAHPTAAPSGAG